MAQQSKAPAKKGETPPAVGEEHNLETQVKDLKTKMAKAAGGEVYGMRVKPLEWKPIPNTESESGYGAGRSEYPLIRTENGWRVYCIPGEGDSGIEFPTKEAAKAAAQADFERRILSALEATPPVQEWEGPLTDEEQGMIDAAWETHKAARPQFLNMEDGEFKGNEATPSAPMVTEADWRKIYDKLAERVKVKPLDEDDYEEIISAAAINMRKATSGIRGQVVTVQDSIDWWVMKETERRILSALEVTPGKFEEVQPGNPEQASYLDGMDSLCRKQFDFLRLALLALDNIPRSEQTALQAVAVQVLTKHLSGDPNAEQGFAIPT